MRCVGKKDDANLLKNGQIGQATLAERDRFGPSVQVLARTTV
jgi:hypothetical protein